MARAESRFVCQTCGASYLRWEGQCRACQSWNSLVETIVRVPGRADAGRASSRAGARTGAGAAAPEAVTLAQVQAPAVPRTPTGIGEVDRVLGGGLVAGSLVLVGGEPGVGKSTLLLQVAAGMAIAAGRGASVLYATGEESAAQVRLRASRLGLAAGAAGEGIEVLASGDVAAIADHARATRPALVVVDSIQTMTVDELEGPAGSVGQVRESALRLMDLAKGESIAVILVGHVTKDGSIAGPKTLEHLVDAVLELGGERSGVLRILRATKNRFGSTEEIGVLELGETGLIQVEDAGRAFLAEHAAGAAGSAIAATMEGTRPLLVEVQALVAQASYGTPARRVSGIDPNRLALLVAVLGRRAGIGLASHDVYANVAGGLAVAEPGLDLPLALALASSLRDRPIPADTVAAGEVGLLGELRIVGGLERRLREAARLGFRRAIVPAGRGRAPNVPGLEVVAAATLREAIRIALAASPPDGPDEREVDPAPTADSRLPGRAPGPSPVLG